MNRDRIFIDLVGMSGYGATVAGVYLQYGLNNALMFGGTLAVLFAIFAAKAVK